MLARSDDARTPVDGWLRRGAVAWPPIGARPLAVGLAALATLLWSTSWLLVKVGMRDFALPPLLFGGLRYTLAALLLLPFVLLTLRASAARARGGSAAGGAVSRGSARWLAGAGVLGLLLYGVTYGAQFVALGRLPAATVSLLLTYTTVVVAVLGWVWLRERPLGAQVAGIAAVCIGAVVYFGTGAAGTGPSPANAPADSAGLLLAVFATVVNGVSVVLARALATRSESGGSAGRSAVVLTGAGMAAGGPALLAFGASVEILPQFTPDAWLLLVWLALVHTAVPFVLWNHALRTLAAAEASVIANSFLVQVAFLAWLFLGEALGPSQLAGLVLVTAGVLVVQLAPLARRPVPASAAR